MAEPLDSALREVRELLLGPGLTRAVAAGRRRGGTPSVVRAELRPVVLRGGPKLQIVTSDGARPYTRNVAAGPAAAAAVDTLLAAPFGTWHVETAERVLQLRVTKKGEAQVHRSGARTAAGAGAAADGGAVGGHDRVKEHLLDPGDPIFEVIGGTAAKRRQVDAFLRAVAATVPPDPPGDGPLRVVDLGCGNAYLTFAAYRFLAERGGRGRDVEVVGVDVREDQRRRNTELARRLGYAERVRFVAGTIRAAEPFADAAPEVVLALHACDTATDEALARAVGWRAGWVLAAPCCHHDIAAQLRKASAATPYPALVRHGILRERFADTLTDALRAALLTVHGYRVDVVEFIESAHTPRNTLLRARRAPGGPTERQRREYADLVEQWRVTPALQRLLAEEAGLLAQTAG